MKTMSYLYNKKKKKRFFVYFVLSVLIILALFTSFYSYIYDILEKPFLSAYGHTEELKKDSKNLFKSIFYSNRILDENEELKKKIERLEVDVMRTEYLESLFMENENIILFNPDIIFTSIIKKNNNGVITILGGIDSNFNIDDMVLSDDGTLLGRIVKVFDNTSLVNLFIKRGVEFEGILYLDDVSVSIKTVGNDNALFTELSREIEIEEGDILYSQEEPGYIVGIVSYIDFDSRDPSKKIYISSIHSVQSLQNIGVIKKNELKKDL